MGTKWRNSPMFAFVLVGIVPTVVLAIAGAVALWPLLHSMESKVPPARDSIGSAATQPVILQEGAATAPTTRQAAEPRPPGGR